jgi:N-acetylglucosamine transport system substrate-binding protein
MKVKKVLNLLIVLVVLLSIFLAGCASTEDSNNAAESEATQNESTSEDSSSTNEDPFPNKELNIAIQLDGYGESFWKTIVRKFESEYPGVKVNYTINPKLVDVIKPQVVSGNPPDLIYGNHNDPFFQAMMKDNQITDLTAMYDSKALDSDSPLKDLIVDGVLDAAKPLGDGQILFSPLILSNTGIIYNKTLFKEKGWSVPTTWDEFFALGDIAKEEGRALFTYQGIYPGYNEIILWPAIASAGGPEALTKALNYEEGAWKSDAVTKVHNVFKKIADGGYLLKGTVALNHTQSQTEMMLGKALFIPGGLWFENEMKDAPREEGLQFGLMPIPAFEQGGQRYLGTAFNSLMAPSQAKNPELAIEFLKYLFKFDNIALLSQHTKGVAVVKNGAEIAKPFISDTLYESLKLYDQGIKPITAMFKATPQTEINFSKNYTDAINAVMNNTLTVEQWSDLAESDAAKLRELIANQ